MYKTVVYARAAEIPTGTLEGEGASSTPAATASNLDNIAHITAQKL